MRPIQVGEWWWCEFDAVRSLALIRDPRFDHGRPEAYIVGDGVYVLLDDPRITWLGPVAAFADPAAIDASAEARLAAGWVLQYTYGGTWFVIGRDDGGVDLPPAPLPAGGWRLAEGPNKTQMWVRWVVAP